MENMAQTRKIATPQAIPEAMATDAIAVPVEKNSKEATFTALAADFSFDDKVKALFMNGTMETLDDFRFYFTEEWT